MIRKKLIRISTAPISLHKLLKGQLKFMSIYYDVVAVSSYSDVLETVRENEGIRIKGVEMTRKITPVQDIKALWKMFRFLRREKPFIVHTHTPKAGIVGMIAASLAGVPVRLHTVAGLPLMEATGNKRRLLNFVEKMTYSLATKVYPNSYGLRDFIVSEKLCNEKKLQVIGSGSSNGIDTAYFDSVPFTVEEKKNLRESLQIDEKDFVFIFIGRLVKDKGINELVAAFSGLKAKNCKLLLVGPFEKDLDPLLLKTELEIENNPNIISVGYQDDVRTFLAISDCLAFPSYREGFPNVVMQAGAMDLPSIVTNINGCNEIIIHNKNGVIIPPKDENALLGAMDYFLHHPEEVNRMAKNARSLIAERYEQRVVWEALLEEYNRLLKKD
ncbi:glycosyltransferase family 4 protein [uncultured Proteiniphilum sp.]|uniref:glycosyltransferase family 4 protein n=1 Tax=uncultured Proteiniphilum sp. TaxID=497637 RepID=UPI00261A3300|nr:glycosyltransferase family 4 protein [uncultured Proteiniphilum sp.]